MSNQERWTLLIDRYLSGECSPEERAELQHLLDVDAEFKAHVTALRVWSRLVETAPLSPVQVDQALARVQSALRRPAPIRRSAAPYLKAAAIIAGVGVGLWVGRHQLASLIEGPP